MRTTKSPVRVMRRAHALAAEVLPDHASRFSRHDYTLAQLFACLVLREVLGLSYRAAEAVLRDADWCARLGMRSVPDHTTLCRAFGHIVTRARVARLLDLVGTARAGRRRVGRTLAVDATLLETHRVSRHYERRCREFAKGRGARRRTRGVRGRRGGRRSCRWASTRART
jgi:hypothetical protein